ncbi:oligo-1,6-glucosidase [Alteribacillus bidgolensis]|uniref:Oligo-1,6-glucosidase n=1 Tax=Alteribacillus bidgolensis TaxID=930129 RepID=A0A1G8HKZ8_9BACI|nr:oligo-1,6-glucosidase [Alteribacillus bidgolensis]
MDYFKELGVDVLRLNPFYRSPDIDNGYDISNYYAIMEKAQDFEVFNRLVSEIHARDMKVIMDLVVNHCIYQQKIKDC